MISTAVIRWMIGTALKITSHRCSISRKVRLLILQHNCRIIHIIYRVERPIPTCEDLIFRFRQVAFYSIFDVVLEVGINRRSDVEATGNQGLPALGLLLLSISPSQRYFQLVDDPEDKMRSTNVVSIAMKLHFCG